MKRKIKDGLIRLSLVGVCTFAIIARAETYKPENEYDLAGVVTAAIEKEDYYEITFLCQNGNDFRFTTYDGDWHRLDLVATTMNSRGTPSVRDDYVVGEPQYCGYISEMEMRSWVKGGE